METDEKVCPFCAEVIKAAAIVCKHCKTALSLDAQPRQAQAATASSKPTIKVNFPDITFTSSYLPLVPALLYAIVIGLIVKNVQIGIAAAVIAVIYVVGNAIGKRLSITGKQIIFKRGIIAKSTVEVQFDKLDNISVRQGIFGRLLGYGHIVAGGGGVAQTPSPCVPDPESIRAEILRRSEAVKQLNS